MLVGGSQIISQHIVNNYFHELTVGGTRKVQKQSLTLGRKFEDH